MPIGKVMEIVLFVLCLLILADTGSVHAAGNAAKAKGLIVEHCTPCHRTPGHPPPHGVAEIGVPPFRVIAHSSKSYTEARLRKFLRRPHWPMTRFILSESDIDNIIAYIESLREQ